MGARADAMSETEVAALLPPPRADGYDGAGKSPEVIAADIEETRAELGIILDALEHRLALRQIMERGMDMLKDTISGDAGGIGEMLREHPVPLALIGLGVGWLAVAATGRATSGDQYPTVSGGFAHAREKAGEAMDQAQQAVSGTADQARQAGKSAWQQASSFAEQAAERITAPRRRAGSLMAEHPLAFGALGLLAGVTVALLLPKSATEERLIGPARSQLRDQAASLGRSAAARAQDVAERTVEAAKAAAGAAAESIKNG